MHVHVPSNDQCIVGLTEVKSLVFSLKLRVVTGEVLPLVLKVNIITLSILYQHKNAII